MKSNPPVQCARWALIGSEYCNWHGGRFKNRGIDKGHQKKDMGYYSRNVSLTLREKLEELERMSPEERFSLAEEIDLARTMASKALQLYDLAFHGETEVDEKSKSTAYSLMQDALKFVADIVKKAAEAKKIHESTVDFEQVAYLTRAITKIVQEEIADVDRSMADRVVERLNAIKIPERKSNVTTPEDLARQLRDAATVIEDAMSPPQESDE